MTKEVEQELKKEDYTPEKIFNKLYNALKSDKEASKYYMSNSAWTTRIRDLTEKVCVKKNISREYYNIDSLKWAYTYLDPENFKKSNPDLENSKKSNPKKYFVNDKYYLKVHNWENICAIEYENNVFDWTDELVKLSHVRSHLKVIISYSQMSKNESEKECKDEYKALIKEKLKFAVVILGSCEPVSLDDNWLIVFGPTGAYNKDKLTDYFVGYKLVKDTDGYKFVEIQKSEH